MWKVGTKVYIRRLINCDRPYSTGFEKELIGCYGTVTECVEGLLGEYHYTVIAGDEFISSTLSGSFRPGELRNLGPHWPTYRLGDMVRICDMSEEEKRKYRTGWNRQMEKYIGQTLRVTEHSGRYDTYKLEGNDWIWHASNLEPPYEFVGF